MNGGSGMNDRRESSSRHRGIGLRTRYVGHGITTYPTGTHFSDVSDLYTGKLFMVIDVSGSMSGHRLQEARAGALELLGHAVTESYLVGVIAFTTSAFVKLDLTTDLGRVRTALDGLLAGGGTDMSRGIALAHQVLRDRRGERVMAIFSDGGTDRQSALAAAMAARRDGIRIVATLGGTADPAFMETIVSDGEPVQRVEDTEVRSQIAGLASSLRPTWEQ
jgi:Mg-chelatase subunit ChlD